MALLFRLQRIFPGKLHLQRLFGLADVLAGLLKPLFHFCDFHLELTAVFGAVHL